MLADHGVSDAFFVTGRIIVGLFYFYNAFHHFTRLEMMAKHAGSKGVPMPKAAIIASGLLLVIGGTSILLGWRPEIGVTAIVLFLVPVTLTMHNFWADTDPMQKMANQINFAKNLALIGSALMYLGVQQPWPYSLRF